MATTCPKCGTRYGNSERLCPHDGTVLEPDQPAELRQIGKILDGKYRLDSFLSRGGMGAVYRATHVMLGRPVAVKLIKADLVTSPDIVRRFQREARAVTHLNHPNIVDVYDLGQTEDGTLYIAMELVSGRSLNEMIRTTGPLAPERIVQILGQVVSALALAHRKDIIHRDLKPHNIMVTQDADGHEVAKLLDFGIAKTFEIDANTQLTAAGSTLGTPQYMSPEQATGADVDGRSDLYSLGIILYEMLVGEVPFSDPSTPAVLIKHMTEAPMPPSRRRPDLHVSPALEAIALRCLEKDPAKRFQTAGELGAELSRAPIEPLDADEVTIPLRAQAAVPVPQAPTVPSTVRPVVRDVATAADATQPSAAPVIAQSAARQPTAPRAAPPLPVPRPGTRPTVAAAQPSVVVPEAVPPRTRSILVPIAAGVLLLAILGAGYWAMTRSDGSAPYSTTASQAQAPPATPAMADPGTGARPQASGPRQAAGTSEPPGTGSSPAPATGPGVASPPVRSPAAGLGQTAPLAAPAAPRAETVAPPTVRETAQPRPSDATPVPAQPTVSFQCTGASEVCGPLRAAVEEAAEREGLAMARGSRGAEIVLTAEVSIVDERQQTQFGTNFVVKTYSVDFSGESRRFDQSVPMPAPKTFSADVRMGRERLTENARVAAADAIERVQQFWKKRVP